MNILHIMASVSDEGGGPIEALVQADAVGRRKGHRRTIVSLDLPADPWVPRCPVETIALGSPFVRRGRRTMPWLRYGFTPHLVPWLKRNLGAYDRVVVNGLWNYTALAARRVLPYRSTPYFVFPHGMLDPWFRSAYPVKHSCKQAAWWIAEGPLLQGARAVLFTSEGERTAAAGAFWPYRLRGLVTGYGTGDVPVATAGQAAAFQACVPALGDKPYLLFLGRLHPKKGCDLLLAAFATLRRLAPDHHLVIAGPDRDGWQAALQAMSRDLGIADRIHWPGMLRDGAKWGALFGCEAFVLPSHGENFGIAVAEALACGKPVLLSHKVNIASEIVTAGAGLAASDTAEGVAQLLAAYLALPVEQRRLMADRARRCFVDRYAADRVAERTLAILENPDQFT
ncbi:glycosyltransferase [Lichenifustis flavocetrariae]|uniref:Glycosyltransferase n=1 Tax=Lichenifustis flavocetrariae TaxID=2949735 RepID=A0AA41YXB9_9HYPH|nr:glycosyltransferase [Lichenifustis flavocetrariae]MCW6506565.1 glycosyltransferase [Lichenifustis flavocetrariae]